MDMNIYKLLFNKESSFYIISAKVLQTFFIIILMFVIIKFGSLTIKKFFEKQSKLKYKIDTKKADTLSTLCISILKYTTYFIAILTILQTVFNINGTTILAAAGVGGIAIGFGAQNLVKDIITGFFILIEDQFVVGDIITIGTMFGTVEDMGLRVTRIRNFNGDLHIVPNGEIIKVTNHTRGTTSAIVDVSVAYEENLDVVFKELNEISIDTYEKTKTLLSRPEILGVTELGESGVVIRISCKTIAGKRWEVERYLRKIIKETFDKKGIEIPYNRIVVIKSDDENRGGGYNANEII